MRASFSPPNLKFLWRTLAALAFFAAAGCGARTQYHVHDLRLVRSGWDSLHVDIAFAKSNVVGGSRIIQPESIEVVLFDSAYDTLYAGPPGAIIVPDIQLGDGERVVIEACGTLRERRVCTQDVTRASPKRIEARVEIEYPMGSDMTSGRYALEFDAFRAEFGGEDWQRIGTPRVTGAFRVWVDHSEARRRGLLEVPFDSPRGSFDLSRQPGYRDFRFYLDSQLLDRDTAQVVFEVHAGLNGKRSAIAEVRKAVFWKSDAEREEDVRYFARVAAERVVSELDAFLGGRRVVAYVDDWRFDSRSRTYELELEVRWEGPFFNRRSYAIEGILEVGEDGSDAVFRMRDANRRAEQRWQRRVDGQALPIGNLGRPSETDSIRARPR